MYTFSCGRLFRLATWYSAGGRKFGSDFRALSIRRHVLFEFLRYLISRVLVRRPCESYCGAGDGELRRVEPKSKKACQRSSLNANTRPEGNNRLLWTHRILSGGTISPILNLLLTSSNLT